MMGRRKRTPTPARDPATALIHRHMKAAAGAIVDVRERERDVTF